MAEYWWTPKLVDVDSPPSDLSISTPWSVDTPAALIRDLDHVAADAHPLARDSVALYGADAVLQLGFVSSHHLWILESVGAVSLLGTDVEIYVQGVIHGGVRQVGVAVRCHDSVERHAVVYRSRASNPREQIYVMPFSSLATNNNTSFGSSDPLTFRFRANGSSLSGVLWNSLSADEPATWSLQTTATGSHATATGYPGFVLQTGRLFVVSIGIGTDGDPAPTGPLSTTEAFALRHNPRTNKVIPVLSAPTVTDIGANCVRPRVTKGY